MSLITAFALLGGCTVKEIHHHYADIEATDTSDATDAPDGDVGADVPDVPDVPDVQPDIPDVPDIQPDIPDVPDIQPDIPDVPDVELDIQPPPSCADGNKCTIDVWDAEAGECIYYTVGCNDGSDCTVDTCEPDEGCVFTPDLEAGCCVNDSDCDDGNFCTINDCEKKLCVTTATPDPECCMEDSDCTDDPCIAGACLDNHCILTPMDAGTCCHNDADCDDPADPCAVGTCTDAGVCESTDLCCVADDECGDDGICGSPMCLEGHCAWTSAGEPECCSPGAALLAIDFEDGSPGDLALDTPSAGAHWHVSDEGPVDTLHALRFADPATSTLSATASAGSVTTPPIELPAGVRTTLDFRIWMDVGEDDALDRFAVTVTSSQGDVVVFTRSDLPPATWTSQSLDLAAWSGATVSITWSMDTLNADGGDRGGVLVDDIVVSSQCAPLTCSTDAQCNDGLAATHEECSDGLCGFAIAKSYCGFDTSLCDEGDPCSFDSCDDLLCVHSALASCCEWGSQCSDGDTCTADLCENGPAGSCSNTPAGCCSLDIQCDDADPCTTDSCTNGSCTHVPLPECCGADAECEDGNPCTVDACIANTCTNTDHCCQSDTECDDGDDSCATETCENGWCMESWVGEPACCLEDLFHATFDSGAPLLDWDVTEDSDPANGIAWHLASGSTHSAPGALRFSHAETPTYASAGTAVSGAIASPTVTLPTGVQGLVRFHFRLANEYSVGGYANPEWDRLTLHALTEDGALTALWDSSAGEPVWWTVDAQGLPNGALWAEASPLIPTTLSGTPLRLVFRFDSLDDSSNDHSGVWLDDVRVSMPCATP